MNPCKLYCRWLFPVLEMHATKGLNKDRERLLEGIEGNILEIGSGAGQNFGALDNSKSQVFALEPSEGLSLRAIKEKSRNCSLLHLVRGNGEQLPFADNSMDAVVSFLVLCSVNSQNTVLKEIFRVLKPGKPFLLFEHVLSENLKVQKSQNFWNPLWKKVSCGCHLNRDTKSALTEAGFLMGDLKKYPHPKMGPSLTHNIIEGKVFKPL